MLKLVIEFFLPIATFLAFAAIWILFCVVLTERVLPKVYELLGDKEAE